MYFFLLYVYRIKMAPACGNKRQKGCKVVPCVAQSTNGKKTRKLKKKLDKLQRKVDKYRKKKADEKYAKIEADGVQAAATMIQSVMRSKLVRKKAAAEKAKAEAAKVKTQAKAVKKAVASENLDEDGTLRRFKRMNQGMKAMFAQAKEALHPKSTRDKVGYSRAEREEFAKALQQEGVSRLSFREEQALNAANFVSRGTIYPELQSLLSSEETGKKKLLSRSTKEERARMSSLLNIEPPPAASRGFTKTTTGPVNLIQARRKT